MANLDLEMIARFKDRASAGMDKMNGKLNKLTATSGRLSRAQKGIETAATAAFATLGIALGSLVGLTVKTGMEFETLRAQLKSVIPVGDDVNDAFALIEQVAAQLPTSLKQTTAAFVKMNALGLTPTEERMLSFGNTASAMGTDILQFTEAVADASTGEFERLLTYGIKAQSELDKVSFTFKGTTTTIGKNSTEIVKYLENIGNTEFAGAAANDIKTLAGQTNLLVDAFDKLLNKIFQSSGEDLAKTFVSGLTDIIEGFSAMWNGIRYAGVGVVDTLVSAWIHLKYSLSFIADAINVAFEASMDGIYNSAISTVNAVIHAFNIMSNLVGGTIIAPIAERDGMKEARDATMKLVAAKEEEIRVHRLSIDMWQEEIASTVEATGAGDKYNETLKKLDAEKLKQTEAARKAKIEQDALNDLMKAGADIYKETRTPLETLNSTLARLQELLDAGAIKLDTYNRAVLQAGQEYARMTAETEDVTKDAADEVEGFWQQAANGMQSAMSDFFFDVMQGNMNDLVGNFKNMIDRMVAELLASKLMSFLIGDFGSTGNVGGLLSGARANGGPVGGGQSYLVGERGPEIFTPATSGMITSNENSFGGGMGSNVSINISALDGADTMRVLSQRSREITEMVLGTGRTYNLGT